MTAARVGPWVRDRASRVYRRMEQLSIQAWFLIFFAVVYTEVFTWFSYLRYLGFLTNAWDLGIFQQALWNSGHGGGLLYYTVELPWNPSGSFLGVHFSPILLLLVPIYTAFPGPLTLMVIQTAAVAGAVFPMYRLAARRIGRWPGATLAVLFAMSPEMIGGVLFDFHVEAFIPLTALTLWAAWEERRYRLAIVAAALMLATIEYAPVILGGIAFGFLVHRFFAARRGPSPSGWAGYRSLLRPLLVVVASLPLTLLLFFVPKLVSPSTPPVAQVGPLGGSVSEIVRNTLTNPGLILPAVQIYGAHKLAYIQNLWWSCLFGWPLAPLDSLAGLPWIFIALVSIDPNYSVATGNQYGFLVVPFLFVGTASALQWLWAARLRWAARMPSISRRFPAWFAGPGERASLTPRRGLRRRFTRVHVAVVVLLLVAVPSQIAYSPLSPQAHYSWIWAGHFPTNHDAYRQQILDLIPPDASVSAEPDLFPHLAERSQVYPYYVQGTQFVVCDITSWWFTTALPPPMPPDEWVNALRQNVTVSYGVYASADGILLLKLGYVGAPVYFQPYALSIPATGFHIANATIASDPSAPSGVYVLPNLSAPLGGLWTGPHVLVPPGHFFLTLWVNANPQGNGSIEIRTSIENGTGTLVPLANSTVTSAYAAGGWTPYRLFLDIPYPTYLEVDGVGTGESPAVEFGGIDLTQLPGSVQMGP